MASKRLLQVLLTAVALAAIAIGLGVGISRRNALSLAENANLSMDIANMDVSDDCDGGDFDETIPRRRRMDENDDRVVTVGTMPIRRGVRRTLRRGEARTNEWPWEKTLGIELTSSMDFSMSPSSKSGKGGKSSKSKGTVGKSKKCHGKSGKSQQKIDLCQKKGAKASKGYSADYEWAMDKGGSTKDSVSPTICIGPNNVPAPSSPTTSNPEVPLPNSSSPTYLPTMFTTYNPTGLTYSPTIATSAPFPAAIPAEDESPVTNPSIVPLTPYPIAALVPSVVSNAVPDATNFPTSGSTPTVSTEVSGPPTKSHRDREPV